MDYTICELEAFSVIGQEIGLTNSQKRNIQISMQFWPRFNAQLKRERLSQGGHWLKYAFMERRNGHLFYYCAIPKKEIIPSDFIMKEISAQKYLVVEHIGSMKEIYNTYGKIYNEILPNSVYKPNQNEFIHFERYDYRFHWNKVNSIIEIWIPIQQLSLIQ